VSVNVPIADVLRDAIRQGLLPPGKPLVQGAHLNLCRSPELNNIYLADVVTCRPGQNSNIFCVGGHQVSSTKGT
jgi:hypothetical protein